MTFLCISSNGQSFLIDLIPGLVIWYLYYLISIVVYICLFIHPSRSLDPAYHEILFVFLKTNGFVLNCTLIFHHVAQ